MEFIPCSNTRGSTPYISNKFSTPYQIRHLQLVLEMLPRQNRDLMELWCSRTATSANNIQLFLSSYLFFRLGFIRLITYNSDLAAKINFFRQKSITSLPHASKRRPFLLSRAGDKGPKGMNSYQFQTHCFAAQGVHTSRRHQPFEVLPQRHEVCQKPD